MKQDGASNGSHRSFAERWPSVRSPIASDRQYWKVTSDFLFVMRPSTGGRFVYEDINPAFEALVGIASSDIREMTVRECMGSRDTRSIQDALDACLSNGGQVRIRHRLSLGGYPRVVETIVAPICDTVTGTIVSLIGSHRFLDDASSPKLERMWSSGANMSAALLSIQEDMQQRIASDLHDSTCQHLIAASLGIMRLRNGLHDPIGAERLCNEIDASIDRALKEIRGYAYLLHPQDLTVAGLKATIEKYAEEFAARTSIKASASIAAEINQLPCETQRSLLRVVQEALTNVFRHAKATDVHIAIETVDSRFQLTVSDNGCGMPAVRALGGRVAELSGVGIPAMRARLQKMGGSLEIRSGSTTRRPGTTVSAVFPCNPMKTPSTNGHRRPHSPGKRLVNKKAAC
jgi:two-component system, NarL family, sensor kinase